MLALSGNLETETVNSNDVAKEFHNVWHRNTFLGNTTPAFI